MKYRTFGRTGWQVSEIAFGGWQLGGTWGKIYDKESIDALHHAFERGINFVDTAVAYGQGRSESVVGEAVKQWRNNKIYVTTKVPPLGVDGSLTEDEMSILGRYPEWHLRKTVEECLQRLQVDCIDLLQLHLWLPDGLDNLDWLEGLCKLRKEGKIQYFGVSIADIRPKDGVDLAKCGLVTSQQVIYNIFEQEPKLELFREGEKTQTAFIARVPFDSGALTGSWDENTYNSWANDDKRHLMYREGRFEESLKRTRAVEKITKKYYPNLAEAAMRFSLSDKAVSTVVCGMRNRHEVNLNTAYSDGEPFPQELKEALKEHDWKHKFYF